MKPRQHLRDLSSGTVVAVRDKGRRYVVALQEDDRVVLDGPNQGRRWRGLRRDCDTRLPFLTLDRASCCPALPVLQDLAAASHRSRCLVAARPWGARVECLLGLVTRWRWGRWIRRRLILRLAAETEE